MPTRIADREIQLCGRSILHGHPHLVERLLSQMNAARQRALHAKKNCGQPYHDLLPDFPAFTGTPIDPPIWAFGTASGEIGWLGLMLMSFSFAFASESLLSADGFASDRLSPKG
jgi:hypothetical protein